MFNSGLKATASGCGSPRRLKTSVLDVHGESFVLKVTAIRNCCMRHAVFGWQGTGTLPSVTSFYIWARKVMLVGVKSCGHSLLLIDLIMCYCTLLATRVHGGCHTGEAAYCGLLNRGWWVPTIRRNMLPPSAGLNCSPGYCAAVSSRV
jgi:hypothetical protein